MVKKSIIEDAIEAAGGKFDREAFAKAYPAAIDWFRGHGQQSGPARVERLTKRETYANLYAQDDGRETLADAIGPATPGGQAFFGVRGLHHATTAYLKAREKDRKRRDLLVA